MQIFLDGVVSGLTIALLALGFAVVYVPTRIYHLAGGAVFALSPYLVWTCLRKEYPVPVAVGLALFVGVVVSLLCETFNHWPLEGRHSSVGVHMVASLGVYIALAQVVALLWGNETKVLRQGVDQVLTVRGTSLTLAQLLAAGASTLLLISFGIWVRVTQQGLMLRALADSPTEFALRGHNARWSRLVAFGWSGLLTATAGIVIANDSGFKPNGGLAALLLGIVATFLAGRANFIRVAVGGILLGILRFEVAYHFSARWEEAATYSILIVALFLRSRRLYDRPRWSEVNP
jgi:branched-chain amino acid transport system permease protein